MPPCRALSKAASRPECCAPRWPRPGAYGACLVAGGADDRGGAAIGRGVIDGSQASLSLGTSGVLFVADAEYRTNPERAVHSFPAARRPAGRGHRAGAVRELRAAAPVGEWFRTASVVRQSHRRAVGRDQDLAVACVSRPGRRSGPNRFRPQRAAVAETSGARRRSRCWSTCP